MKPRPDWIRGPSLRAAIPTANGTGLFAGNSALIRLLGSLLFRIHSVTSASRLQLAVHTCNGLGMFASSFTSRLGDGALFSAAITWGAGRTSPLSAGELAGWLLT